MRRRGVAVLLAVLALVAGAPAALADHVYSHQFRVFGRVVDAEGAPVSGAIVFMEFLRNEQPSRTSARTDCLGDYGYGMMDHFHVHNITEGAEVRAAVFDPSSAEPLAQRTFAADPDMRKHRLDWRLGSTGSLGPCADSAARLASTAVVVGRLWNATEEGLLERVTVHGEVPGGCRVLNRTAPCQPVEVVVVTDDGARANVTAWSNPFGDYFAFLDLGRPFAGATATATWLERGATARIDPVLHTAEIDLLEGSRAEPERAVPGPSFLPFAFLLLVLAFARR